MLRRTQQKLQWPKRFIASLLAFAMLLAQPALMYATMDTDAMGSYSTNSRVTELAECFHDVDSVSSHGMQVHDDLNVSAQDCCALNDCVNQCQNCISFFASALIPALVSVHKYHFSQTLLSNFDQSPSGSGPSQLYRPPRALA